MQVTAGADWWTASNNRRSYAISLDIDDLREMKGAETVDKLSRQECLEALNKACEMLVVSYVAKEGGVDKEWAAQRIKEIKNG